MLRMNKSLIYPLALMLGSICLSPSSLSAQQPKKPAKSESIHQEHRERIRAEKRAFLVKELSLTTAEADALMPLLNELDDKRFGLWRELEPIGRRLRQGDKTLTAEEMSSFYDKTLDFHVKEAELERTYYLRAKTILSGDRLVRLPWVCKEFARRYFDQHRQKKH